uniref:Uncharacterized protein n=1 Tax=Taeniopygia guttata TaxID=59729 RepID=A0A674H6V6_TAEGU
MALGSRCGSPQPAAALPTAPCATVGSRGSDFSFSALGKSMPGGPQSCLDSFASSHLCRRVWVRFCLPREPHGLSFLAVYGSDQIRLIYCCSVSYECLPVYPSTTSVSWKC